MERKIRTKNNLLQIQKSFLGIKYWTDYITKKNITITWEDGIAGYYGFIRIVTIYEGDKIIPSKLTRYGMNSSYINLYNEIKKHI